MFNLMNGFAQPVVEKINSRSLYTANNNNNNNNKLKIFFLKKNPAMPLSG